MSVRTHLRPRNLPGPRIMLGPTAFRLAPVIGILLPFLLAACGGNGGVKY